MEFSQAFSRETPLKGESSVRIDLLEGANCNGK